MIVKSLINTRVETLNGKVEVKEGEYFETSLSEYRNLGSMYKSYFELVPEYFTPIEDVEYNGTEYKEGELYTSESVSFIENIRRFHLDKFEVIETLEQARQYDLIEEQ